MTKKLLGIMLLVSLPLTAWRLSGAGYEFYHWIPLAIGATLIYLYYNAHASAAIYLFLKRPETALLRLEKAYSNSSAWQTAQLISWTYLHINKAKKAAEWAETALATNPDHYESYYLAGFSYLQLNRPKKAAEILNRGVRIKATPEGRLALALAYARLGHNHLSLDQLRLTKKKSPVKLLVEAEMAFAGNDEVKAMQGLLRTQKSGLKLAGVRLLLSRIGKKRGLRELALENYLKGLKPPGKFRWLFGTSDETMRILLDNLRSTFLEADRP